MLKSEILEKLHNRHQNLETNDIETVFKIFIKKLITSLKNDSNIEIRGFGTISKKVSKEKFVRNPRTNERLYKKQTYKLHFKIGKSLHKKLNSSINSNNTDVF